MRYLTLSELIYINGKVVNNPQLISGKREVRDLALLDAAVSRPSTSAFGEDAYPTLREKTAALFHSLVRNHPFTDGNKRTATVAAIFMLRVNGQRVVWHQAEALEVILNVAENRWSLESLAVWLPLEPTEAHPEPEADSDMQIIHHILTEQKWLLDELNQR